MHDLHKSYTTEVGQTPVLEGVSLTVDAGEYLAIMGPSGAGKTTLMNIIGCLDRATDGRYLLDGIDVSTLDDEAMSELRNQKIGFVFQQFHLLDRATAVENVALPLVYAEKPPDDPRSRAVAALEEVGLADRLEHRPGQLSGGQQQRVAIARALVNRPEVLLVDEPTGNLDDDTGHRVLDLFDELHAEGRTIVMITHDRADAERAERLLELSDGRLTESDARGDGEADKETSSASANHASGEVSQ
ncbi:MAG: ABC transporter ATP-binding protein [Persicimonas sp.]